MDELCAEDIVQKECPETFEYAASTLQSGIPLSLPESLYQSQRLQCKKESGFRKTARTCLMLIQEALFRHQWQRAAELMRNYFQTLEDTSTGERRLAPEIIWRLGTEILLHHPNSDIDAMNSFADRTKNLGVRNYLKVSLEHAFHLMVNGMVEDAYRDLSLAESWRYGHISASQEKVLKLIQAYKGLLDYCNWVRKKATVSDSDDFSASTALKDMHNYFRQASINLCQITKLPGVWDPFILSYVNLLEFYDNYNGALEVLNDYAYDSKFPPNPNAHVYLYKLLKRHHAPQKKLIGVLKILYQLVPSHELMLELNSLLQKSNKEKHHKLALTVLFSLLDFVGWKENAKVWKRLKKQMKRAIKHKHRDWITEEWELRKDWWPVFHFSAYQAQKNLKKNEDMAYKKATVARILLGKGCKYFKSVYREEKTRRKAYAGTQLCVK
ncbi:TATA box-binding protein-associated factor RNA polymerase I subunit A [Latimeria chalumnae]|uniref:TATA box-binding protein-associated factor RNA polymerase I subunit A n=1 Tax=Latimeria chalumnae TaxID=7897 RepID=UPI0006D91129|nr:PREDICTED: TATA box-binding protein-associated factor RNA polymerase I subunit A [Latimeria chalumnae]|eukprot:XP_014343891.1 PREDICTED: TATA box-binding protein-associated factor RNA polymerase I subunit A [Latimeria chalumnae]